MKASIETLEMMVLNVLDDLPHMSPEDRLALTVTRYGKYHGFRGAQFGEQYIKNIAREYGYSARDIQLELLLVGGEPVHIVHMHQESNEVVIVLGCGQGFPDPAQAGARIFHETDGWLDVGEGTMVRIPLGAPHGFTVNYGNSFCLLSVRSPWTIREDGQDDYIPLL